jgi:hypothetical protein
MRIMHASPRIIHREKYAQKIQFLSFFIEQNDISVMRKGNWFRYRSHEIRVLYTKQKRMGS